MQTQPTKRSLGRPLFAKTTLAALALVALLFSSSSALAQAVYGQILGTVTDPTGAAVPNATVTVTDVAKGVSVTAVSNASGEFTVDHLIPDTYNLKVTAAGFKGYTQTGLALHADTSSQVTAVLAVGASDQVVTVNADQEPQLKTDRADVATVYTAQELTELPIPDHNFANLQLLLPGAVQLGWAHAASENPQGSKQIQIDGQAFGGVNYTLDGTDNQDAILGIIVINPNSESMSEAKISTQNYDAEFGKAVASVQTVQTKSGSNQFHGSLFDNRESNANLAKDPFTLGPNDTYGTGLKNQFGGSIGGPILKDKIFFFGDYQGVRQKVGSTGTGSIPTLRALQTCTQAGGNCDLSDYLAVKDSNGNSEHQIYNNNTGGGAAYAGNLIPNGQLAPQAVQLFKLLLANGITPTSSALYSNYSGAGTGIFNSNQWDVRGDYNITQKIHVFGRFSRFTDTLSGSSLFKAAGGPGLGIAGYGGVSNGANDSFAGGVDIAVTSKLVTDVRLGYFRYDILTHKNDTGNTNLPFLGENVSTPGLAVPVDFGTPDINIADANDIGSANGPSNPQNGGAQFGTGLNMNHCNCPLKEKEDQFQIVNNWTRTIGNHAVKFGVDLRYARNLRVPSDNDRTGVNNFGNGPTSYAGTNTAIQQIPSGLGLATFLLGDVSSFNRYTSAEASETNAKEFQKRDFGYVQDTWRATPKLTVNAGLRYEFYSPERVNGKDQGALMNLQTGYINVAGEGPVPLNMGVGAPKWAFNPRMGVAYQMDSKTVIRAGYGRSFDLGVFGSTFGHVVTQNLPVLANQSLNGTNGITSYAFNLANPTATGNGATSPLYTFTSPAIGANGGIAFNASIPGTGALGLGTPCNGNTNVCTQVDQAVSVKVRPFTERLPTLDAWNFSVQRSLTPTMTLTAAYVGNKGTHTLSDGDGNNTNPNEAAIFLPANLSITGTALHYDGSAPSLPNASGATSNATYLRRYYGGSLPACNGACVATQDIAYYGDDQDTHYNALQVSLAKSMTRGLSLNGNYAYQVGTDNASSFATWNKRVVIGNDSDIRRSAFTAYGLYHLPFGKGQMFLNQGGILNYIVGGFEFSPTFVYQSGLPYTLGYSNCSSNTPGDAPCQVNGNASSLSHGVTGHANKNGYVSFFKQQTLTGNFTSPGLDQIGNSGRNNAWGPGFFNSDMSISKAITFHERYEAKFRMDAYNAFNHINFANPNGTIDSSTAGQITSGPYPAGLAGTTNPRQLQFTVHLAF